MEKQPTVYVLANTRNGTPYVGSTSDLVQRVWQHRNGVVPSFTRRYAVHRLVYFELYGDMEQAIYRERCIKKWNRQWKLALVEARNPQWCDLWSQILD